MINNFNLHKRIVVYGAYGHTGYFVVNELLKKGYHPILSGRSHEKLKLMSTKFPNLDIRAASIDDPASLNTALRDVHLVINCAGPFVDTAVALIARALQMGVHYIDVAAEQQVVMQVHEKFEQDAAGKRLIVLPAMAFFGGLADLLASWAIGHWQNCDSIDIAVALNRWLPTAGTRTTGERTPGPRLILADRALAHAPYPPITSKWNFQDPVGLLDVQQFPLTEVITIAKHIKVDRIHTYLNLSALNDIRSEETPAPTATDESGRSDQQFLMEVLLKSGEHSCLAIAKGRDIYAITAPLIVEAATIILEGRTRAYGVVSAGKVFLAGEFLNSIPKNLLEIELIRS